MKSLKDIVEELTTPSNTMGIANPSSPTDNSVGSGDLPNKDLPNKDLPNPKKRRKKPKKNSTSSKS